jgi:uncharacterized membrane protein YheB (UPF0754 family)
MTDSPLTSSDPPPADREQSAPDAVNGQDRTPAEKERPAEEERPDPLLDPAASEAEADEEGPPAPRPRRMRRRVLRAILRNLSRSDAEGATVEEPPRKGQGYARWLPVLRAVPWMLAGVFALSFVWDFPGVTLSLGTYQIALDGLLRIVSVSGWIGFLTNWLAITMLFQPREQRPLVGQGVIPAQRERVAWRLAQAVSDELINEAIIGEKIRDSGIAERYRTLVLSVTEDVLEDEIFRDELRAWIRRYLHRVLATEAVQEQIVTFTAEQVEQSVDGLPGLALQAYRLFDENDFQDRLRRAVQRLPQSIDPMLEELDPLLDRIPEELAKRGAAIDDFIMQTVLRFVEQIDIERIVLDNVRDYDERQLEMLLKRTTNEQLTYIKYLGGVLGTLGGLVIWRPVVSLLAFLALALGVYAVDEMLLRARASKREAGKRE